VPRRLPVRLAALLLALLIPLGAVRASTRSCASDDCDLPCCDRDPGNQTVLPVLPCCRTVTLDQLAPHAAPTTLERDEALLLAPAITTTPAPGPALAISSVAPPSHDLPAPPLYHRHCALLL